jgi:isopentenyl-diphosphate delta-isomerase
MEDYGEVLDLVNKDDEVIGTVTRDQVEGLKDGYVRAAEMLIINSQGKIWVPRRSMHKKLKPGGLDYSCAGHVASGETYEQALEREVEEELNFKPDPARLKPLHKFPPVDWLPPYFRMMYLYSSDETPDFNKDDFSGYEWLTPAELRDRLKSGETAKDSLIETVEYLISQISNEN